MTTDNLVACDPSFFALAYSPAIWISSRKRRWLFWKNLIHLESLKRQIEEIKPKTKHFWGFRRCFFSIFPISNRDSISLNFTSRLHLFKHTWFLLKCNNYRNITRLSIVHVFRRLVTYYRPCNNLVNSRDIL